MVRSVRTAAAIAALGILAGCSTSGDDRGTRLPQGGGIYKVGNPYQVAGVWYYPREQPNYDETGIASWYGAEFHNRLTANGERFDRRALTAAHPTLPMPVNVRVTNLENGRSVVLRVNDRGPFKRGRILDVSEAAAEMLGFKANGTARVRVTLLGRADRPTMFASTEETPPELATALNAAPAGVVEAVSLEPVAGAPAAAERRTAAALPQPIDTPALTTPAPDGSVTTMQVPARTRLFVQAGAFSSMDNALRLQSRLRAAGPTTIAPTTRGGQTLYRVRVGPFDAVGDADAALARVLGLGHNEAEIVVD